MRSLRWLLLVLIAVIAAGVFHVYRLERQAGKRSQRPVPPMMAMGDKANAKKWEWTTSANGKPSVDVTADEYVLAADSKTARLKGVELRIYQKNGEHYDRVRSDYAEFKRDDNMHEQMSGYRRLRKQHQKQLQEVCVVVWDN